MFFRLRSFFLSAYYRYRMKYTAFAQFSQSIGNSGLETPNVSFDLAALYKVRRSVLSVCEHTPWESKCMVQALTAKKLLNSMGYPCTLYMGVMNSPDTGELLAHAWLRCGDKIVTGDNGYLGYTVTGKFGDNFEPSLKGIIRFKAFIRGKKESGNRVAIGIYKLYTTFVHCARFLFRPRYRAQVMVKHKHPDVHQTTLYTGVNCYPEVFNACKEYFKDKPDLKILSFGCSTGEEVVALRHYFPNATIVGADINDYALSICRKRKMDSKVTFIESTHENISKHGPFDLICCMAVLQRTPGKIYSENVTDLSDIYPFHIFEEQIVKLDSYLKDSGLLALQFCQYSIEDTSVSDKYVSYSECSHYAERFGGDNILIEKDYLYKSIYRKSDLG